MTDVNIPWNSGTVTTCLIVTVAIYLFMWFVKKTLATAKTELRMQPWFRGYILTPLPIVVGVLIGFLPLLPGDALSTRMFFGGFCGLLTVVIRNVIKRRVGIELPKIAEEVQETEEEKNGGSDKP